MHKPETADLTTRRADRTAMSTQLSARLRELADAVDAGTIQQWMVARIAAAISHEYPLFAATKRVECNSVERREA